MPHATEADSAGQSNGGETTGLNPSIPGGEQKQLPSEPQAPEASTTSKMGSTCVKQVKVVSNDTPEKSLQNHRQTTIDQYYQPNGKKSDATSENINNRSPKRSSLDDDDEGIKRSKPKPLVQSASNNDSTKTYSQARSSGPTTRSSTLSPKLRLEAFEDSDEDDNSHYGYGYSSWAKKDIADYRNNYPYAQSDPRIKDNWKFYTNKIPSHPDGDYIDNIHEKWFGQYRKLEYHHGYIQWLFPLQERGLNWSAEALQKHEIELIKKDPKALKRVLKSYKLMLDFYGFELVNDQTGEIRRLEKGGYIDRFDNLNTSSHNYLRITRILKCLGEFGYEYLKFPFLEAILRECITEDTLGNCLRSCKDYWIETLRSQNERRAIRQYARELIKYRNKGILPPGSFRAERPASSSSATRTKVERMSISDNDDPNPNA